MASVHTALTLNKEAALQGLLVPLNITDFIDCCQIVPAKISEIYIKHYSQFL
jgi:hypothetical protein